MMSRCLNWQKKSEIEDFSNHLMPLPYQVRVNDLIGKAEIRFNQRKSLQLRKPDFLPQKLPYRKRAKIFLRFSPKLFLSLSPVCNGSVSE